MISETYYGDDNFLETYYHANRIYKTEPESEVELEARKRTKEMLGKRECVHVVNGVEFLRDAGYVAYINGKFVKAGGRKCREQER